MINPITVGWLLSACSEINIAEGKRLFELLSDNKKIIALQYKIACLEAERAEEAAIRLEDVPLDLIVI